MPDDQNEDPPVSVAHQARFTDEGKVSTEGEVTETALTDHGAEIDGREREIRLDRPEASGFAIDDGPEVEGGARTASRLHCSPTSIPTNAP